MKENTLRNLRIKALFLLFLMLVQIISPTASWALASGPIQSDFAAYEEPNTTDMVNLITGDFTYNIPILEVPSPEGGFRMPLSYHAGIQLDEESSWVGLGWSLNAGAIARNINQYADDYEGKPVTTTMSGISGDGYIKNYILYQSYYDSKKGHGGTFGFGNVFQIGMGSMSESSSVLGISSKNGKTQFDAVGFASGVTEIAILVASYGSSAMAESGASAAFQALDFGLTAYQAFNAAGASNSNSLNISSSDWKQTPDPGFFKTTYSYYLDVNKTEHMFGSLYLNKVDDELGMTNQSTCLHPFVHNNNITSINNSNLHQFVPIRFAKAGYNAVSDMHMNNDGTGDFEYLIEPTSIAYDNYNVMGIGISGEIKPFRLDVGSLAYPNLGDAANSKYVITNYMDYKVNFKYSNDNSNSYTNSLGDNTDNVLNPSYGFNLGNNDFTSEDITQFYSCYWSGGAFSMNPMEDNDNLDNTEPYVQDGVFPNFIITDKTVNSEFQPNYISTNRKETDRNGLKNNHLASGKFVQWYSNAEILNGSAKADGFIDFLNDDQRTVFRASTSSPAAGIGGFMITREDGLTYHYSLPVYNKNTITYLHQENGVDATLNNGNKYAYDWLLTAITGPDFVDRGTIGIIDELDYGYWAKMDYGLFASNFNWRDPYLGKNYSPSSLNETSLTVGIKETYYLNTISTRTNTALFVKSLKSDGKGAYSSGVSQPSSALKLDNIIILSNKDYQTLVSTTASGGLGLAPDFNSGNGNSTLKNGDSYNNVLDNFDISSSGIQSFLNANQIRNVHFNYSYNLCGKTYNSFDWDANGNAPSYYPDGTGAMDLNIRKGKLTLESIDIYGKNNFTIIPPFIFNYGNVTDLNQNPNYNSNKWDGWGMYKLTAGYNTTSHKASNEGSQWSLKKIITPIGAEINIEYERDSYSSINGNPVILGNSPVFVDATNNTIIINNAALLNSINVGDLFTITAHVSSFTYDSWTPSWVQTDDRTEIIQVVAGNINGNIVAVSPNILSAINVSNYNPSGTYPSNQADFTNVSFSVSGNFQQSNLYLNGGDLRVKEISVKNENGESLKTKYVYTKDGNENSITSGVVSSEPEFSRNQNFNFYKFYDHPATPVLYAKVTVYSNISSLNNSFLNKTEYNFTTPDQTYLTFQSNQIYDGECLNVKIEDNIFDPDVYLKLRTKMYNMVFKDFSSKIGSLNSIKNWNNKNQLMKEIRFNYSNNSNGDLPDKQGIYGESTVFADRTKVPSATEPAFYYRLNRTSKVKYPNILKEIDVTSNGQTITTKNEDFNFITGQPTTTRTVYPNSETQITKVIPAYFKYQDMGSKVDDIKNKNMLSQKTSIYNYVSFNNETEKLIAASVQTWSNWWNYREYLPAINSYATIAPNDVTFYASGNAYQPIWRKYQSYVWKSLNNSDGSLATFADYVWGTTTQNAGWQKTNEVTRYNHYSQALEAKDINNRFVSTKFGYNDRFPIASAANAKYTAFAYSGAEDLADGDYFGAEVSAGFGGQNDLYAHTGVYSVAVDPSKAGFTFNGSIGNSSSNDFKKGQKMRTSVWLYTAQANKGRLSYNLIKADGSSGGSGYVDVSSTSTKQAGNWYLLTLDFDIPVNTTATKLLVYVSNTTAQTFPASFALPIYFDDFRVHPQEAVMSSTVYDETTGWVTAVLDADNFATKFTYDAAGRLIRTDKETLQGFKKVSENTYHYGRPY